MGFVCLVQARWTPPRQSKLYEECSIILGVVVCSCRRRRAPEGAAKAIAWDFARPLGNRDRRRAGRGAVAWDSARPFEFSGLAVVLSVDFLNPVTCVGPFFLPTGY